MLSARFRAFCGREDHGEEDVHVAASVETWDRGEREVERSVQAEIAHACKGRQVRDEMGEIRLSVVMNTRNRIRRRDTAGQGRSLGRFWRFQQGYPLRRQCPLLSTSGLEDFSTGEDIVTQSLHHT